VKERGILMATPMVRATLAGAKTQTRRVASDVDGFTPQGEPELRGHSKLPVVCAHWPSGHYADSTRYGQPGARLWVREAWRAPEQFDAMPPRDIPPSTRVRYEAQRPDDFDAEWGRYRHARFMPRWASRIDLEAVKVRIERLQAISEADCIAEGIQPIPDTGPSAGPNRFSVVDAFGSTNFPTAKGAYGFLWESINGAGSWDANPWVWVVEFKRVTDRVVPASKGGNSE
jgi:hypothetical protein